VAARIRDACAGILAGTDERQHWSSLRVAVGSLPPSQQTVNLVESVAEQLSLSDYLHRDVLVTLVAADLMGSLSRYFQSNTREHLEKQFVSVAGELSTMKVTDEERDALSTAVLGGLLACAWSRDAETRAATLAKLLEELEAVAPEVLQRSHAFVLRLCETLPPPAARHFWRVRELIRRRTRL